MKEEIYLDLINMDNSELKELLNIIKRWDKTINQELIKRSILNFYPSAESENSPAELIQELLKELGLLK